jgi:hypothetical protein
MENPTDDCFRDSSAGLVKMEDGEVPNKEYTPRRYLRIKDGFRLVNRSYVIYRISSPAIGQSWPALGDLFSRLNFSRRNKKTDLELTKWRTATGPNHP